MKFTLSQDKYYLISLPAYLLQFGREATPTNLLLFSYDRIENRVSNNFVVKRFSKLVWILEGDWHNMVGLLPFVHSMFTTLLCCGGQVELLAYLTYVFSNTQRSYQRWLDNKNYKMEMKFWAVLGSRGCREKNLPTAISMQLFGVVF